MIIELLLVRHGKTEGNAEGRYIGGRLDEDLCSEGIAELELKKDHINSAFKDKRFMLFASPMIRCESTAKIFFPDKKRVVVDNLREMNFGRFEGKTHCELSGSKEYQDYINSFGNAGFPGGESIKSFADRCMSAFWYIVEVMKNESENRAVVVCHGGSIMAIMSCLTGDNYFDFKVKNGEGYLVTLDIDGKNIAEISYSGI